eukprot:SAG22_NODE_6267_length_877_cov_1.525707_2_plen_76_part_01
MNVALGFVCTLHAYYAQKTTHFVKTAENRRFSGVLETIYFFVSRACMKGCVRPPVPSASILRIFPLTLVPQHHEVF